MADDITLDTGSTTTTTTDAPASTAPPVTPATQPPPTDSSTTNTTGTTGDTNTQVDVQATLAELATYKQQVEQYKPDAEFVQQRGGRESVEPFLNVVDTLTAAQFDAANFARAIHEIDPQRYSDVIWDGVNRFKNDIAAHLLNQPEIRQTVLGKDVDYQKYQAWKAAGSPEPTDPALDGLDPNDPAYQYVKTQRENNKALEGKLSQIETAQREATQRATQEAESQRVSGYISQQEGWLKQQVEKLGWGDEYKQDAENVSDIVMQRFSRDAEATNALQQAIAHIKNNSPLLARRYTHVVQAKLAQHFKTVSEYTNKQIQALQGQATAARAKQEQTRHVPGGASANTSSGTEPLKGKTMEERVLERLSRGSYFQSK